MTTAISTEEKLSDIHLRMRRLETRMTRYLDSVGFDTGVQRARWTANGTIDVPTPSTSIKEALSLIPAGLEGGIPVVFDGRCIAFIRRPTQRDRERG